MKKIATWLAAGVIVATAAAGCSVEVIQGDGGTATGGSGGSGGSTGGSGGTGGAGGAAGATGGTAGAAGSAGTTGGSGGTADAGSDAPGVMCTTNPNDPACNRCSFTSCQMEHCACNAVSTCRGPMLQFFTCVAMPNADPIACGTTFVTNANVDGSGAGLANDLGGCLLDKCVDICQGRDASTANRHLSQALKAALGRSDQR